jgi:hypothetical protein
MKPLADGQPPALAEDRADTTSSRCVTSLRPTRLCRPPDKLRQPQDPMSAHISASAPTAQFKLASPPRSVVPQQRNSRSTRRVLDRRLGGDAAAPSIRSGSAPRPAVAVVRVTAWNRGAAPSTHRRWVLRRGHRSAARHVRSTRPGVARFGLRVFRQWSSPCSLRFRDA